MKKIIVITSHKKNEWCGGDSVITHGLLELVSSLKDCQLTYSVEIPFNETDSYVAQCDYVIHAGTPSWMTVDNRRFWHACIKHKKHIAMLGVGLAVPYSFDIWYGVEDFINLRDAGLIDMIVCRDKFCYYWLKKLGYFHDRIHLLPCPGFYISPITKVVKDKTNVVLSLANVSETAKQNENTFRNYYEKKKYVLDELRARGAVVELLYQRDIKQYPSVKLEYDKWFPNETIYSFDNKEQYLEYVSKKDVYVGVRNHGAISSASIGLPALLMGTDNRQFIADEIPFINRIDISHADWNPRFIFSWYDSLHTENISQSLIKYKDITKEQWLHTIEPIRQNL